MRQAFAESSESSDLERSCSPTLPTQVRGTITPRRLPARSVNGTHVVIHEYAGPTLETTLFLGDRLHIVDNGDPDWLHAFKVIVYLKNNLSNFTGK